MKNRQSQFLYSVGKNKASMTKDGLIEMPCLDAGVILPECDYVDEGAGSLADDVLETFHILMVGNEQSVQSMHIILSVNMPFDIDYLEARSGNAALQALKNETIDLVIVDCDFMSDMDGIEFLEQFKHQRTVKERIPVIEILKADQAELGVNALRMGAHDFLLKNLNGLHLEQLPILVSRVYSEKMMKQVLLETAGFQQALTEAVPSVIYRVSLQGGKDYVHLSPAMRELGMTPEHWGSDTELHHRICHEADRREVVNALRNCYQNGKMFKCEYRVKIGEGSPRWFQDKARVIMDKHGRPLALSGVMLDVTQIKALEKEIGRYRDRLEKMVSQRTEKLRRRISILEACNTSLSANYHHMRKMYSELNQGLQAC